MLYTNRIKWYKLIIKLFVFNLFVLIDVAGWSMRVLTIASCLLYSIQPTLGCGAPQCGPNEVGCYCPASLQFRLNHAGDSCDDPEIYYCSVGGKCQPEKNGCSVGMYKDRSDMFGI